MPNDLHKMEPAPLEELPGTDLTDSDAPLVFEVPRRKMQRAVQVSGRQEARDFISDELEGEIQEHAAKQINAIINVPVIPEHLEYVFFQQILANAVTRFHRVF